MPKVSMFMSEEQRNICDEIEEKDVLRTSEDNNVHYNRLSSYYRFYFG